MELDQEEARVVEQALRALIEKMDREQVYDLAKRSRIRYLQGRLVERMRVVAEKARRG